MYLYGASGHSKVIMDILAANGIGVTALVDDNFNLTDIHGVPVVHSAEGLSPFIISIGSNKIRRLIARKLSTNFISVVHPTAVVSSYAKIGLGTVVMQNAVVQSDVFIGRHCIINTSATVDHDCRIGDYVHISPNVSLCGNVHIGDGTQIGAGSIAVPGVKIGKWSIICAGSVVTKDLPDFCIARGNPCVATKIFEDETFIRV